MQQSLTDVKLVEKINSTLAQYSDKDWNYSRISLIIITLEQSDSPFFLTCDWLEVGGQTGKNDLKSLEAEVKWGDRHSAELGILELISLRLNKALLEVSRDEAWGERRPVVRVIKREDLAHQGVTTALWYEVKEVAGDDFENR